MACPKDLSTGPRFPNARWTWTRAHHLLTINGGHLFRNTKVSPTLFMSKFMCSAQWKAFLKDMYKSLLQNSWADRNIGTLNSICAMMLLKDACHELKTTRLLCKWCASEQSMSSTARYAGPPGGGGGGEGTNLNATYFLRHVDQPHLGHGSLHERPSRDCGVSCRDDQRASPPTPAAR